MRNISDISAKLWSNFDFRYAYETAPEKKLELLIDINEQIEIYVDVQTDDSESKLVEVPFERK